jgi:predicted MPP superfamily phosphohydrolase
MHPFLRSARAATAAGIGLLAYATLVERRWYALRHVTVPVLRPGAGRPLRVLHLSDLHLLPGQTDRHAFVRRCLALGPDMVVATGDLLGSPDTVDTAVELLGPAAEGRPALAVLGSNDFFGPVPKNPLRYVTSPHHRATGPELDTPRLVGGLESAGWRVLENVRLPVDTPAGLVDVAGLGDPHIGRDHAERVDWSAPQTAPALRLGVVHAPYLRALDVFAGNGYDLVLAGHTHGGQLRVPGYGALVSNCDLPTDQARGLSRHRATAGELWLHVSAGLGHSRYAPIRFCCRPEVTMIDLVPAQARPGDSEPLDGRSD